MCACRQRHVEPVVDEHPRARAAHRFDAGLDQTHQRAAVEIALPNLNELHAGGRRRAHAAHDRVFPGMTRTGGDP